MIVFFLYLLASIILTFLILKYPYKLGEYFNLVDLSEGSKLKIHKKNTSVLGGFIILILVFNFYFYEAYTTGFIAKSFSIYLLFFSFFLIGLLDDYLDINPLTRIFLYSLTCYISLRLNNDLIIEKFYSELLDQYILTEPISIFFTIFCFIFLQNILNMFDGINGSLSTYLLTVLIILLFISFSLFKFSLFIIILFILYWNLNDKIFLGNNGASVISSIFGFLLISMHDNNPILLSAEKIIILFCIPLLDLSRLFIIRILNNKSPFEGDLDHFHHLILSKFHPKVWVPLLSSFIILCFSASLFINSYFIIIFISISYLFLIKKFKVRD